MDIEFFESDHLPKASHEVKVEDVSAEPYPDGRRVRVMVRVTAFLEQPNLTISASDSAGHELGESEILGAMTKVNSLVLHLRGPRPEGDVTVKVALYFPDKPVQSEKSVTFALPAPEA